MQTSTDRSWYAAFKAKDARFDGRFFVGISSTGIYCRPVCRARLPKAENCAFYGTAAAAEQAGFRPCLLCRPELAPGAAPLDATASLARKAARLLEEGCGQSLEELANRLGCTDRHLRRAFAAEYKVSPIQYLQTCRLLLAKNLLTDTDLPVIEVAMAAGFGSLRRFNDLFKKQYRLAPGALRRQAQGTKGQEGAVTLTLGYRPPYQWPQMLDFLAQRAVAGLEAVADGEYWRAAHLVRANQQHICAWLRVAHQPRKNALAVTIEASLLPVLPQVLARIRHLFDLGCAPEAIYEVLESMNHIRPGLCVPGVRLPGCFDPFETAVRAVLGQQTTLKAARALSARLAQAHGRPLRTSLKGLTHAFPSAEDIMALPGPLSRCLEPLGISPAKADIILELARIWSRNHMDLSLCAPPEAQARRLMEIPGLQAETAQYIALRAWAWPDAFAPTDSGVQKALAPRTAQEILALAEGWRPWRGYAVVNLWNSL